MINAITSYKDIFKNKRSSQKRNLLTSLTRHITAKDIDATIPIDRAQYVVFDTELTGLHPKKDSIVSIGAIKMDGGRILLNDIFYRLVEPRTKLTGESVIVHEITPSEATECPSIDTLLPEFLDFCENNIIVGHFVAIDTTFINLDMKRLYGAHLRNPSVDTLKLYTWIRLKEEEVCAYHGGITEDTNLFSLAKKYGISVNKAHNALDDAFVTAQLFQRFISLIPKFGIRTVGDLLKIAEQ
jgi:DNA polymerase-3 subunit epsilon